MRSPRFRDTALMLVFAVGMPLAAGSWWRYFSGYDHPEKFVVVVEQAPSAQVEREANEKETKAPVLAWTTGTANSPAGRTEVRPGDMEER
jgi:hypothetical protein